jgi:hypothetical protein
MDSVSKLSVYDFVTYVIHMEVHLSALWLLDFIGRV